MAGAALMIALLGWIFSPDQSIDIEDIEHSTIIIGKECDCDDDDG